MHENVMNITGYGAVGFPGRLRECIGDESVRAFARKCEMTDSAIRKYLSGEHTPNLERLIAIAEAAGVDVLWLATGEGASKSGSKATDSPDDVIWIDSYNVLASAGNGTHNDWEHLEARVPFSTAWLEEHGLQGKRLAVIKVQGDSMTPTLDNGDTPLVELLPEDAYEHIADGVYVLRLNGALLVKRLQSDLMGGLYIKSDNPAYDKIHISPSNKPDDIRIIAKWTGKKI